VAFRGSTQLALDGKGRLAIPARYRERLTAQCGGHLMLTADPTNGCLLLYPYPEFEILERQINSLPGFHPLTQQLKLRRRRLRRGSRTGQRRPHPDSAAAA
jgi:MraZ protein